MAIVGQLHGLIAFTFGVAIGGRVPHHRHRDLAAIEQVKRAVLGLALFEGFGPGGVEVNGVGQNQPRQRGDKALGDQVLNAALGLVAHPVVDGQARGFRV